MGKSSYKILKKIAAQQSFHLWLTQTCIEKRSETSHFDDKKMMVLGDVYRSFYLGTSSFDMERYVDLDKKLTLEIPPYRGEGRIIDILLFPLRGYVVNFFTNDYDPLIEQMAQDPRILETVTDGELGNDFYPRDNYNKDRYLGPEQIEELKKRGWKFI